MIKLPLAWLYSHDERGYPTLYLVGSDALGIGDDGHIEVCHRANVHDALVAALGRIAQFKADQHSDNYSQLDEAIDIASEALADAKVGP